MFLLLMCVAVKVRRAPGGYKGHQGLFISECPVLACVSVSVYVYVYVYVYVFFFFGGGGGGGGG